MQCICFETDLLYSKENALIEVSFFKLHVQISLYFKKILGYNSMSQLKTWSHLECLLFLKDDQFHF